MTFYLLSQLQLLALFLEGLKPAGKVGITRSLLCLQKELLRGHVGEGGDLVLRQERTVTS